jgi:hypothetical protein
MEDMPPVRLNKAPSFIVSWPKTGWAAITINTATTQYTHAFLPHKTNPSFLFLIFGRAEISPPV